MPTAERLFPAALAGAVALFVFLLLPGPTVLTGILVALAYVLFLPFWRDFSPPPRNFGLEDQSFANAWDFVNIFGLFLFIGIPFLFVAVAAALRPADEPLGGARRIAMWIVGLTVLACWVASIPAVQAVLPFGLQGSLRLGLAILAVLAFFVAVCSGLTSTQRIAVSMLAFAFAVTAGTDIVFVWDRMNTIFKFYLESWFLFAAAGAAAAVELWRGLIRRGSLRFAWQLGLVVLLALSAFTAATGVWAVVRTDRVPTPEPTLDGTAYLAEQAPLERAAFEWLNDNVAGIPVIAEAYGPSYQDYARVAMNTGLPTVLGWDYHVQPARAALARHQPAQGRPQEALHDRQRAGRARDPEEVPHRARLRRRGRAPRLRRRQPQALPGVERPAEADLHEPRRHRLRRRGRVSPARSR